MAHRWYVLLSCCVVLTVISSAALGSDIPRLEKKDGRYALFVDGAPFLVLGAQINNSSAWPSMLPWVWPAVRSLHANTVEAPIYWEQVEPHPGRFDFSVMDTLIRQAREHKVRLVLLWFGTWKNGAMHYAPEWIKTDTRTYPRMVDAKGEPMDILSPFGTTTLEADKAAFRAVMRHLKEVDGEARTVIMVQVENEAGSYGAVRDFSAAAQKEFESQVPSELTSRLKKSPGNWQRVFGSDADEAFAAYAVAHYIDQVAAAGKVEYPLPMYVNAALCDPEDPNARPGANYPSGGPTHNMFDVWKAVATSVDFLAPDIYLSGDARYRKVLSLYHREDNPLFVAETSNKAAYAKYFFAALGEQAIGFSPFGIDYTGYSNAPLGSADSNVEAFEPFAENYRLIAPMQREIARLGFEGKIKTAVEAKGTPSQSLDFGKWHARVSYGLPPFGFGDNPPGNPDAGGRAMVAQLGPDEFLVTGMDVRVDFALSPSFHGQHMQYLRVEEGQYKDGQWEFSRIWNGDQTDWGLNFKHVPHVLRVKLMTF